MGIIITFLLGIANFTALRAVLDSGHPMLASLPPHLMRAGVYASMAFEFILLVAAMLAARSGAGIWLLVYLGYSLANGFTAWLITTRRV